VDGTTTEIDVSGMAAASRTVTGLTAGKRVTGLTAGKLHSFTIAAVAGSTESTQSTAVTATPVVLLNTADGGRHRNRDCGKRQDNGKPYQQHRRDLVQRRVYSR
jgi:hypothetical protein